MTNMQIKIRNAVEADHGTINSLYLIIDDLYNKKLPKVFKKPSKSTFPRGNFINMLEEKESFVIVAEMDKEVVGFLYARLDKDGGDKWTRPTKRVVVEAVSVFPNYARHGIGTMLIQRAEKWAKENNTDTVSIFVYNFNEPALNFYHKNGYKPYSIQVEKKL